MAPGDRTPRVREPIILLGAPRSGTSLLADVLGAHPDVVLALEPRLVWRYGNDAHSDQLSSSHARSEVIDHIHRTFAALLREREAVRLVEKTPANSVRPRFVDAVFPDAVYVHITRNGWGAVPSIRTFWERRSTGFDTRQVRKLRRRLREAHRSQLPHYAAELAGRLTGSAGRRIPLYGPRLAGLEAVATELGVLSASALQWRTCVEETAAFGRGLAPGRYLEVRLESLDADTIMSVVAFCGLRPAPDVVERFAARYRREEGTRQAPLTDDERAVVAPYVESANAMLGYPPDPPDPPTSVCAVDVGQHDHQTPQVRVEREGRKP